MKVCYPPNHQFKDGPPDVAGPLLSSDLITSIANGVVLQQHLASLTFSIPVPENNNVSTYLWDFSRYVMAFLERLQSYRSESVSL